MNLRIKGRHLLCLAAKHALAFFVCAEKAKYGLIRLYDRCECWMGYKVRQLRCQDKLNNGSRMAMGRVQPWHHKH
jgi:hypothetical protein